MFGSAWLAPLVSHRIVRKAADAGFVQFAHNRTSKLDRLDVAKVQENTLLNFLRLARGTRFGQDHRFDSIHSIKDYQERVPIREYDEYWTTYWKDAYPRLDGITWPGFVPYYALSSGTTSGTTKYIPVSREMLRSNHKAAYTTMSLFRHAHPRSSLFNGKFFFLGGSTDLRQQVDGSFAGDLSGIAAKEVAEVVRPYSFPPLEISLITDWEVKLAKLAELSVQEPISAISGVPSWVLILFDRVKQITGKKTIADIWPELRLIVHGGTKFDPYRELFRKEIASDLVHFCEVYPCSEGFVATEDPRYGLLRIIPDHDIFFEFVPVSELGQSRPKRHTLATVEIGEQYAVVLTNCAGLWSYLLGDTVCFERRDPPLIRFTGRTKYFLSAFGEHLIQEEVDKAVARAAQETGVGTVDHHVGPVFPSDPRKPGHHLYLVEFRDQVPGDLSRFAQVIDEELCKLNEDYAAHRVGDLTMLRPQVRPVPKGGFAEWMKSKGKGGGQHKVPRMDNTGNLTKEMVTWFEKSHT